MPKTGRRNLLKMIGLSPALLVPWTPATEQPSKIEPSPPPPPAEPEKLTLEEALRRVDWDGVHLPNVNRIEHTWAPRYASVCSPTASVSYSMPGHRHPIVDGQVMPAMDRPTWGTARWDDGPDWGE